jgi:hypothetical protein
MTPETGPTPILRSFDQAGPNGISLDIPTHPQKMTVAANWNRLEPSLIDCAQPREAAFVLPPSGVRSFEPVHEARERAIDGRSQHEMPMGGHAAVRKNVNLLALEGLFDHPFECVVVARILEKDRAFGCSIKCVKVQARRSVSSSSRHRGAKNATSIPNRRAAGVL